MNCIYVLWNNSGRVWAVFFSQDFMVCFYWNLKYNPAQRNIYWSKMCENIVYEIAQCMSLVQECKKPQANRKRLTVHKQTYTNKD